MTGEYILEVVSDVSLSKEEGRYLADKSYAFDTIFFLSKFILHNSVNYRFNRMALRDKAKSYAEDIFQLTEGTSGAVNYFTETMSFLVYANVLEKHPRGHFVIKHREILEFVTERVENAYVFNYIVVYQTLKNEGLLPLFERYCGEQGLTDKEKTVRELYEAFCNKSVSIKTTGTQWSKQLVKYSLTVLGFINGQNEVTRELRVKDKALTVEHISINVAGSRTPSYLPKKNDYLQTFNVEYVGKQLQKYLFKKPKKVDGARSEPTESIGQSLADLKLAMLDVTLNSSAMSDLDREQYIVNTVKTRNQSIQRHFRKGLLDNDEHKCPVCGFSFEGFLVASHIKPYSKCDDTYDAINHYNGFLMCPNHDKLFEGAEYMTIDAKTGEIILSPAAQASPEYGELQGRHIPRAYVESERRHYLKWHNERFFSLNKT